MSTLHKISGCNNEVRRGDVVFVHGLGGDAFGTWRNGHDQSSSWPHWLGDAVPDVGVWSLGYAASPSRWSRWLPWGGRDAGHAMSLPDRSREVLDQMVAAGLGGRPLVFVGHSLGGLLVKQILRASHDTVGTGDERLAPICQCTSAVVFLSTPHAGAALASLAGAFATVFGATVAIDALQAHDAHLRDLGRWYGGHAGTLGIRTVTFFEDRAYKGVKIVNATSANPGVGAEPIPLDEDHISIAKPRDRDARVYRAVIELLDERLPRELPATPGLGPAQSEAPTSAALPLATMGPSGTNPYDAWQPVVPPQLVGRDQQRRDLLRAVEANRSVSVVGDWRIGKSSLLQTLELDLHGTGRTVATVSGEGPEGASVGTFVAAITGRAATDQPDAAANALGTWAAQQGLEGLLPVLLADEFGSLIPRFPYRFFERLRGLQDRLVLIVASRQDIDGLFAGNPAGSPFHNRFQRLPLGLLEAAAADALIRRGELTFGSDGAALMRLWAGRHPFYLQLLGYHLVRGHEAGEPVDDAITAFRGEAAARLRELWRTLDDSEHLTLKAMTAGTPRRHRGLKERGILTGDGTAFGRVLSDWIAEEA